MGARVRIAAALDIAVIVLFAVIGRRNHDDGQGTAALTSQTVESPIGDVLGIATPFLIGLAAGWIVTRAWRRPFDLAAGRTIWVVTIALGMVLRSTLFEDGIAFSFVIVASVFTGLLLLGWRVVAGGRTRRITHQN
ncbi:MAG TPA: DUF3054 domain-containing protein [Ilumatobacteraceae bacterium]|nr:DUF3054 domain-containing protein [Ilumatobacteraceae bacterium]